VSFFPRAFALKKGVLVFLNGKFVPEEQAVVSVGDRGFLLGDGLFETMRVVRGKPFRLAQHLDRLMHGAAFLKIKMPFTPEELETFAGQLVERNQMPEAVLRLTLTRGPGGRGYAPVGSGTPTMVMTLHPVPPPINPEGWSLVTSSLPAPVGDPLAAFKTSSKIRHVLARAEAAERGADEALLVNTNGEVAETAGGNLFWAKGETLCTVPADRSILPGITRAVVLEICDALRIKAEERVIKPAELEKCGGIFVTQSVFGIVPVRAFDGRSIASSPLVTRLTRAYNEMPFQPRVDPQ
jgi:branched-chain amino acid aminotransferase